MSEGPLRIGVLGAARITPAALIWPAQSVSGVDVTCVAARDRGRAEDFAREHGIGAVLNDYAAVLGAELDAVYVPLPISAHLEWTVAALEAGLHVLCEKAIGCNANEAERMRDAAKANERVLMEAFHYRYHPLFGRVLSLVAAGAIGSVHRMAARFDVPHIKAPDIRLDYATGGGALMDLGCYPLHWMRHVAGREPTITAARAVVGPPDVDLVMEAEMTFAGATGLPAVEASLHCSMDPSHAMAARLHVEGDAGEIEVINPIAPQMGHELRLSNAEGESREQVDRTPTYTYQLEAFRDAVRGARTNLTDGDDAVANMRTIDAIYDAAGLPRRGEPGRG